MKNISWSEYDNLVNILSSKILDAFPGNEPISIVGIPRGGVLLAILLSYKNKRFSPSINRWWGDTINEHVVIVDDVLETGKTLKTTIDNRYLSRRAKFAVLIDKTKVYTSEKSIIDIAASETSNKEWIVFPYEKIEDEIKSSEGN